MQDIAVIQEYAPSIDISQYITSNCFFTEGDMPNTKRYYCKCGHAFVLDTINVNHNNFNSSEDDDEETKQLHKLISSSMDDKIHCPYCKASYSTEKGRMNLVYNEEVFITALKMEDNDSNLSLYCTKFAPDLRDKEKVHFYEATKHIRFEKDTKRLFFANYNELEREFDLEEVIKVCNTFFKFETIKIVNLGEMQFFINNLSGYVSDSQNINIINELIAQLYNKVNESGADVIKKIVAIFFGIIKYSSLSTLAMVKGPTFLYDIMVECDIPNPDILRQNNVTSPLTIFNFLIKNYVRKMNEEIGSEDKESHDFVYKSNKVIITDDSESVIADAPIGFEETDALNDDNEVINIDNGNKKINYTVVELDEEKTLNINFNENKGYKEGKVVHKDGKFQVMDSIEDGSLSKFIFKNIKNFNEYKQIVKYFKLVGKQEIIILLQKYNVDFLTKVIDMVYFRAKVGFKELQRILDIILDYTILESKKRAYDEDGQMKYEVDYKLMENFDFYNYDDCLMMIDVLKFDRHRHFDKLKTYNDLKDYHDYLINLYASVKTEEKNGSIMNFVKKFRFMESSGVVDPSKENNGNIEQFGKIDIETIGSHLKTTTGEYNGPLQVIILDTPGSIIRDGIEQKHSGFSYAPRISNGTYLMVQVFDKDPNRPNSDPVRYTAGFDFSSNSGLEFSEIKSFGNEVPPDRMKKLFMIYLTSKDISFRQTRDLKLKNEI